MINFSFGPNVFLGLLLALGAILFYGVRYVREELARIEDVFFTTISLFDSYILIIHGWRLDPILIFGQGLIIITILAAGWEIIRLRGMLHEATRILSQRSQIKRENVFIENFEKLDKTFKN